MPPPRIFPHLASAAVFAALAVLVFTPAIRAQSAPPPAALKSTASSANAFALRLFQRVAANPDENAFLSPYSISTALAMTWAGAQGRTATQFATLFPSSNNPAYFGLLQQSVTQAAGPGIQLSIANSLWPQQNHPFLPAYLDEIRNSFASNIFPVDFATQFDPARLRINAWVADQTHDRIQDLLQPGDVSADTRLVLVNAIYFKGNWANQFDPKETIPAPFHLANGGNISIPFMRKQLDAYYAESPDDSFQILALPYTGGNLSFIAILPQNPAGLSSLESNLTSSTLSSWLGLLPTQPREIDVSLPKFKLTQRYALGPALQALGLTDAFNPLAADFSGMDGARDLFISAAIHQAFIEVNEQGTEAAAATAIGIRTLAIVIPPVFRADHPFLFFIRDNATGAILFLGRLANPGS